MCTDVNIDFIHKNCYNIKIMHEYVDQKQSQNSVETKFRNLLDHEPKLISNFTPDNAVEQKAAFIAGEVENPQHVYSKLATEGTEERLEQITRIGHDLITDETMPPKYVGMYHAFANRYVKMTEMMIDANTIVNADSTDQTSGAVERFMKNNINLYGAPDEETYRALLLTKVKPIAEKTVTGTAATLQAEVLDMVGYDPDSEIPERFTPSSETVEWVGDVVHALYDGMLSHVPDQEKFTVTEVQAVFDTILREEFGDSASEWSIDVEPATSIDVKVIEKRVVLPDTSKGMTRERLQCMVVHELGVHVLRAVAGASTDLGPMQTGFPGYYDSEEGLGVVMEQALKGKFEERGAPLYITAGLAYHDNKNFRETYEAKWRMSALTKCKEGSDVDDALIEKAKNIAYAETRRIFRGTDQLPWFKDLAYYNGSTSMWKHLEAICGDYDKFQFVLMGKADSSNAEHFRVMYETRTF